MLQVPNAFELVDMSLQRGSLKFDHEFECGSRFRISRRRLRETAHYHLPC